MNNKNVENKNIINENRSGITTAAIVLAAGVGKRMNVDIPKQYLDLAGKPVLYYSLKAFEDSQIDYIVLVTSEEYEDYCKKEIIDKYNINKVKAIVYGGKERYNSVYNGLKECINSDYVFIHDGARPMINTEIITRGLKCVIDNKACIAAMPVKDTIKSVDSSGIVQGTPNRKSLYLVQTPQIFKTELVISCYEKMAIDEMYGKTNGMNITDDAMIVEYYSDTKVSVYEGDYKNIKITTPEDIAISKLFLSEK